MFKSKVFVILALVLMVLASALVSAPANESANGSAKITVVDAFSVAGNEIKSGQYNVQWQSASSEAAVLFKSAGKTVATVRGKIVMADKAENNTWLIRKDASGHPVLKSIQFSGKKVKIVFE